MKANKIFATALAVTFVVTFGFIAYAAGTGENAEADNAPMMHAQHSDTCPRMGQHMASGGHMGGGGHMSGGSGGMGQGMTSGGYMIDQRMGSGNNMMDQDQQTGSGGHMTSDDQQTESGDNSVDHDHHTGSGRNQPRQ